MDPASGGAAGLVARFFTMATVPALRGPDALAIGVRVIVHVTGFVTVPMKMFINKIYT